MSSMMSKRGRSSRSGKDKRAIEEREKENQRKKDERLQEIFDRMKINDLLHAILLMTGLILAFLEVTN